jgi:hypothetical protein
MALSRILNQQRLEVNSRKCAQTAESKRGRRATIASVTEISVARQHRPEALLPQGVTFAA